MNTTQKSSVSSVAKHVPVPPEVMKRRAHFPTNRAPALQVPTPADGKRVVAPSDIKHVSTRQVQNSHSGKQASRHPGSPTHPSCPSIFHPTRPSPDLFFPFPPHTHETKSSAAPPALALALALAARRRRAPFSFVSVFSPSSVVHHPSSTSRAASSAAAARPRRPSPAPTTAAPAVRPPSVTSRLGFRNIFRENQRLLRGILRLFRGLDDSFVDQTISFAETSGSFVTN